MRAGARKVQNTTPRETRSQDLGRIVGMAAHVGGAKGVASEGERGGEGKGVS